MGTTLPPNEDGLQCSNCWGSGKTFGDTTTPKYVTLKFRGLSPGNDFVEGQSPSPNRDFLCEQTVACTWQYSDGTFTVTLLYTATQTFVTLLNTDLAEVFFSSTDGLCELEVFSSITSPADQFYFSGQCEIDWSREGLS